MFELNHNLNKILVNTLSNNIDENLKNLSYDDWDYLFNISYYQNVNSCLYYYLKKNNLLNFIPEDINKKFDTKYKKQTFDNLRIKTELINIIKEFNKNDIPTIILKGSHLSFFVYESIGMRYARDIDLIVPIDKSKKAFEIAKSLGYMTEDKNDDLDFDFKEENHIQEIFNSNNTCLEIHGYLHKHSKYYNVPIDYLWNNSQKVFLDKYETNILSINDLILHLIIHISYQDNFALDLRHYLDIFIVLEKYKDNIDWDNLINLSKQFNIKKGVFIVLNIIKILFNFDFPKDFFEKFELDNISLELINYPIDLMWAYNKNSGTQQEYFKYRSSFGGYGDFFELSTGKKITKFLNKIFVSKEELNRKYGKFEVNKRPYYYYIYNIYGLINKNKFILNNDSKSNSFIENTKKSYTINKWILDKSNTMNKNL